MNQALFSYIAACPTAFQAAAHTAALLESEGYRPLRETEEWMLEPGGRYYVTRNGSSLIAFRLPKGRPVGFMMTAAHGDSPTFKIKENAELTGENETRLSVEGYGGMLCASWMDRPLSVAGRAMVRTENGVAMHLIDLHDDLALIPNVAIHMNRDANNGAKYNFAVDMQPLYGEKGGFHRRIAEAAGVAEEDLLTHDLFLYNPQPGVEWGDYISAPRLDDLQCAFAALQGFLTAGESQSAAVYCLFDNEEVGSQTKQGAASTFLRETLERICDALGLTLRTMAAGSFLLSCDNAHAVHPNHPEYADKNHAVRMNGGVVIKYNASQRYTTDAVSAALFQTVCEAAGVPFQRYANRPDMAGGSTLGSIANTQVSLNMADIGLAQLAMHSAFETAGAEDTAHMVQALKTFFGMTLRSGGDGTYQLR